jgi:hypothetical protein
MLSTKRFSIHDTSLEQHRQYLKHWDERDKTAREDGTSRELLTKESRKKLVMSDETTAFISVINSQNDGDRTDRFEYRDWYEMMELTPIKRVQIIPPAIPRTA